MSFLSLTGTGFARPTWLLLPEGQDVADAELTKAPGVQVDQVGSAGPGQTHEPSGSQYAYAGGNWGQLRYLPRV